MASFLQSSIATLLLSMKIGILSQLVITDFIAMHENAIIACTPAIFRIVIFITFEEFTTHNPVASFLVVKKILSVTSNMTF